ncbi:MAG: hypothetical protein GY841_03140 [FCB group bacterium]|nr:hypothetical protein [FCB group bacterium]
MFLQLRIVVSTVLVIFSLFVFGGCGDDDPVSSGSTGDTDTTGTIRDFDGNFYQTVKIGDQWWMAENLKATHYRNGDEVPIISEDATWRDLISGACCAHSNDIQNVNTYGRLYNWYAVDDSRKLAPTGWHVPTDAEWKQLEMYLGMSQAEADRDTDYRGGDEGGKLKYSGPGYWTNPNAGATDESGFSALPGGSRSGGNFFNLNTYCFFWTSSEDDSFNAWTRGLYYDTAGIYRAAYDKTSGYSVRCVKD